MEKKYWFIIVICLLVVLSYIGYGLYEASKCPCGGILDKKCDSGSCALPICGNNKKVCGICMNNQQAAQIPMEISSC
jgi:hypothetical protein